MSDVKTAEKPTEIVAPKAKTPAAAPAAAAPAPAQDAPPPKRYRIHAREVTDVSRHQEGITWRCQLRSVIPYDELFKPETWCFAISGQHGDIRPGNTIQVIAADFTWRVDLDVWDVGAEGIVVTASGPRRDNPNNTKVLIEHAGYEMSWDIVQKWHVVRKKDRQVVSSGHRNQSEAHVAMIEIAARRA